MNPKAEIFFDAITLLREDIVEEAQDYRFRKSRTAWKKIGSLAACLVLIASVSLLAVLPKGCGGSAPPMMDAADSTGAPSAGDANSAPADVPAVGEPTPDPGNAGLESGGSIAEQAAFTATVIEIQDGFVLVEPAEGERERDSADRIAISVTGLELPELSAGDTVLVTYDGSIREGDPAKIAGTAAIERIEEG